tara:strand:+ start:877 stop:1338 length:462 start_codon:yes stop_codon:yes gene_type:complete
MKPNPFTTDRLPDFTRTVQEVANGDRITHLEQYINALESVLLSIAEAAECDVGELIEAYRMTPARAETLKREKQKAQKSTDGVGTESQRSSARRNRIDLIKMKTKPMAKREFSKHPDLLVKYFPDELPDRNRALSDKALNKDLKAARKAEKKK